MLKISFNIVGLIIGIAYTACILYANPCSVYRWCTLAYKVMRLGMALWELFRECRKPNQSNANHGSLIGDRMADGNGSTGKP